MADTKNNTKTVVFAAAGVSSRFGGSMKALAKVGPNNEPLLELSFQEVKEAGYEHIVLIVSDVTMPPLKKVFGHEYEGIKISYCIQKTPEYREKPLGTTHALLAAEKLIKTPFIFLNADDLYGQQAIIDVTNYMNSKVSAYCLGGYKLKNVLNDEGTVNRGLVSEQDGFLVSIVEQFDISRDDIPGKYSGDECISMNFFGLQTEFLEFAKKDLEAFFKEFPQETEKELLLPETVSRYLSETGIRMAVIPVSDVWLGLTYQKDVKLVQEKLEELSN